MGRLSPSILFLKYHLLILGHLFTVAIKADRAPSPVPKLRAHLDSRVSPGLIVNGPWKHCIPL